MKLLPNWVRKLFVRPSPMEVAASDLNDAEHALLEAQNALEWAHASCTYQNVRIARLRKYLAKEAL